MRAGQEAVRLAATAAGLSTGVLDAVRHGDATTAEVADRVGTARTPLLLALLGVLESHRLLRRRPDDDGTGVRWRLTPRGRAVVDDDVARAAYEAYAGYHTGLYRELRRQLDGGPGRRDVTDDADVVARSSAAMTPFVTAELTALARDRRPRRVLDVGCGAGGLLAAVLEEAPGATGVGVDVDSAAVDLARQRWQATGLGSRTTGVVADLRDAAAHPDVGDGFDLVLLANVVYYLPVEERVEALRTVARLLAPGGAVLVVTTLAGDSAFTRHLDLLLRAQEGRMELPSQRELVAQLLEAGLVPGPVTRVAAGEPLVSLLAERPVA
ncbi:SAM-dependent methyltransferase [Thalassiella azotivora]